MECEKHQDKYLMHSLKRESGHSALGILNAGRIIGLMDIVPTTVGRAFDVTAGIELSGKILPLQDLRIRCEEEPRPYDERSCIILIQETDARGPRLVGMVVESISE
jgi:purine-binding chemotaxis protein CheW